MARLVVVVTAGMVAGGSGSAPEYSTLSAADRPPLLTRWTGFLGGECPALTGPAARRHAATSPGARFEQELRPPPGSGAVIVQCSWPTGRHPLTFSVTVWFFDDGYAPTGTAAGNASHRYATLEDGVWTGDQEFRRSLVELTGWGPAIMIADGTHRSVAMMTAAGNVLVGVIVYDGLPAATGSGRGDAAELLDRIGPAARELLSEVITQLRPS